MQLRIDDIWASTKQFNQHAKIIYRYRSIPFFVNPIANLGFIKRIKPFAKRAKYDELTLDERKDILWILRKKKIIPIIWITATRINKESEAIPFYIKFKEQAELLKDAFQKWEIIIANHGLTHCVVGKQLPKFRWSNQRYHREFRPYLDQDIHNKHIIQSQMILEKYFKKNITIFIPPGNVRSYKTYKALQRTNIKTVISKNYMLDYNEVMTDIKFLRDKIWFINIHDRELKLYWRYRLLELINKKF